MKCVLKLNKKSFKKATNKILIHKISQHEVSTWQTRLKYWQIKLILYNYTIVKDPTYLGLKISKNVADSFQKKVMMLGSTKKITNNGAGTQLDSWR